MGRKVRGAVPLFSRGAESPSNIMWPGQNTCTTNFIFIYPNVWPQHTNARDRQSETDTQDSIERTVLQTVSQKWLAYAIIPLSDCFITLVYCGQTVAWIKMSLDAEVGLGSGHVHYVSWRPSFPYGKGHSSPLPLLRFTEESRGPCLLWPCNGWMDQDTTWYGGRPRPKRHCVRWGPSSPCTCAKRSTAAPHTFRPTLLWQGRLLYACQTVTVRIHHRAYAIE